MSELRIYRTVGNKYGNRLGVIVIRLISLDLRSVRFANPGLQLVADASLLPFEGKKPSSRSFSFFSFGVWPDGVRKSSRAHAIT